MIGALLAMSVASAHLVDDGRAIPDDGMDDRIAFDLAIEIALLDGTGIVEVPCGVFDVSRTVYPAGSHQLGAVNIFNLEGLKIRGQGACSVVRNIFASSPSAGNFNTFNIQDSQRIGFEGIVIDGASETVSGAAEQTHLVRTLNVVDLSFDRVVFTSSWGDALKMTSTTGTTSHVVIKDSKIQHMKRNGVTFHNGITDVDIRHTTFEDFSDQAIDFEPGSRGPQRVLLDGIRVYDVGKDDLTIALSGGSVMPGDATRYVRLTNSYIEGEINLVRAGPTQIHGNTIISASTCLSATRYMDSLSLVGNTFDCNVGSRGNPVAGGSAIFLGQVGAIEQGPSHTVIASNHIFVGDSDAPRFAIEMGGGLGRTIVSGNMITSSQTGPTRSSAFRLKSTNAGLATGSISFQGNVVEGFLSAMSLSGAPGIIRDVLVVGNSIIETGVPAVGVSCSGTVSPRVSIGLNLWGSLGSHSSFCSVVQ